MRKRIRQFVWVSAAWVLCGTRRLLNKTSAHEGQRRLEQSINMDFGKCPKLLKRRLRRQ